MAGGPLGVASAGSVRCRESRASNPEPLIVRPPTPSCCAGSTSSRPSRTPAARSCAGSPPSCPQRSAAGRCCGRSSATCAGRRTRATSSAGRSPSWAAPRAPRSERLRRPRTGRMKPVKVFVAARGNAFMADIAGWIAEAAALTGRDAAGGARRAARRPTVRSTWSSRPTSSSCSSDASDDEIARAGAAACRSAPSSPARRGSTSPPSWCATPRRARHQPPRCRRVAGARRRRPPPAPRRRAVDGGARRSIATSSCCSSAAARRAAGAELAALGPQLWDRAVELRLFRFSRPIHGAVPGTVFGRDKYELLARSRVLLNIHRDDVRPGYFEWARMIEAMANGCAVLTEPSTGFEPLVEGRHFVATDDLAGGLERCSTTPTRCAELGEAARAAVLERAAAGGDRSGRCSTSSTRCPIAARVASPRRRRAAARVGTSRRCCPSSGPLDGYRREVYVALLDEQRLAPRHRARPVPGSARRGRRHRAHRDAGLRRRRGRR